jgi:hypothetical protein
MRSVLPLVILAGALYFASPVYADGRGGRPPVVAANKQPSNPSTDQRAAKKEARMKQRDQEMDKRMKREKASK